MVPHILQKTGGVYFQIFSGNAGRRFGKKPGQLALMLGHEIRELNGKIEGLFDALDGLPRAWGLGMQIERSTSGHTSLARCLKLDFQPHNNHLVNEDYEPSVDYKTFGISAKKYMLLFRQRGRAHTGRLGENVGHTGIGGLEGGAGWGRGSGRSGCLIWCQSGLGSRRSQWCNAFTVAGAGLVAGLAGHIGADIGAARA